VVCATRDATQVAATTLRLAPLPPEAALQLLLSRVQMFCPERTIDVKYTEVLREIVQQSDGIPILLELVARRAAMLPLDELAKHSLQSL